MIKFKPWQTHPHNAWNNLPECDETFISPYKHFVSTNYAKQHIATITEELHRAEQYEALQPSADDTESTWEQSQEEWMLLCQLQPTFTTRESTEENIEGRKQPDSYHNHYYFHAQTGLNR